MAGRIKAISGGIAKFDTSCATLDVPLTRILEAVSATDKSERARKHDDDIRCHFVDKGMITLQLIRLEKDVIKGQSENFGEISLPLGGMRRLEFNLYQARPDEDEDEFAEY